MFIQHSYYMDRNYLWKKEKCFHSKYCTDNHDCKRRGKPYAEPRGMQLNFLDGKGFPEAAKKRKAGTEDIKRYVIRHNRVKKW